MENNTNNPTSTPPPSPIVTSVSSSQGGGVSDFFGRNKVTILIVAATIVLGGVAIFTALRLYQMRQQPTPSSIAQTSNLGLIESPSPSPTESGQAVTTGIGGGFLTSSTATPSATPTATASATPKATIKPTVTPIASASATLPNTGVETPTIIGIGLGILLLIGAVVFRFL